MLKKFFGGISMGWKKVIVLSLIAAVYTATINLIPILRNTSFQDIAINFEAWILFAIIIIMNCEKRFEAVLKTFVFFLISQPLIYLIEAVIGPVGFSVFDNYKYWFFVTLLTIPGAAIAFQVKKKGLLGALSLSVAVGGLGYMAIYYFRGFRVSFPNHFLSFLFCLVVGIGLIFILIDEKKLRIMSLAIMAITVVITLVLTKPSLDYEISLPEGDWTYEIEDESVVTVEKSDSDSFFVKAGKKGMTLITFTNENGEIREYYATISNSGVYVNSVQ